MGWSQEQVLSAEARCGQVKSLPHLPHLGGLFSLSPASSARFTQRGGEGSQGRCEGDLEES